MDSPYLLMISDPVRPAIACSRTTQSNLRFKSPMTLKGFEITVKSFEIARHQAGRPQSHIIRIAATKHEDFSDRLIFRSPRSFWLRPALSYTRMRAIISAYILSFFKTYVANDQHAQCASGTRHINKVKFIRGPPIQSR